MKRGPGAGMLVERALVRDAALGGVNAAIMGSSVRPWASVTFAGARHHVTIACDAGEAADAWLAALPERDLPVTGHLMAEVVVTERRDLGVRFEAEIELLSVEER